MNRAQGLYYIPGSAVFLLSRFDADSQDKRPFVGRNMIAVKAAVFWKAFRHIETCVRWTRVDDPAAKDIECLTF